MDFSQFWSRISSNDEELRKRLADYEEVIKLLATAKEYCRDLEKEHDDISRCIVTAKKYCGDLEKEHSNISRFIEILECWSERLYSKQMTIQDRSQTKKLIDEESD